MLQGKRELTFRPSPRPLLKAPLTVRSVGHYRLRGRGEVNRPRGFTQLFWIAEGRLRYRRGEREFSARTGEGFFYEAGEPHEITPSSEGVRYHWLTFDGGFAGEFLSASVPGPEAIPLGECPEFRFRELFEVIGSPEIIAEHRAAALGYSIFLRFCDRRQPIGSGAGQAAGSDLAERARRQIERRFSDPAFGIEPLARDLQCHRATLFRVFRARHRMSPVTYLQRARLREALRLLRQTDWPVQEVGYHCGFSDPAYFARTIRLATGDPPRMVRQRSRES